VPTTWPQPSGPETFEERVEQGIVVEFVCVCDAEGVYLTGAAAPAKGLVSHQHAHQLTEAA